MMKVLSALLSLLTLVASQTTPSSRCMYCQQMDTNAGFLVSYSYCAATDTCLMDAWNYIHRPCTGDGWQLGANYEIGKCNPTTIACPSYNATSATVGTYTN